MAARRATRPRARPLGTMFLSNDLQQQHYTKTACWNSLSALHIISISIPKGTRAGSMLGEPSMTTCSESTTDTMTEQPAAGVKDGEQDHTLTRRPWRTRTTPWNTIVQHTYKGSGVDSDPYVVTWIPNEAENPQNYSAAYKWWITIIGEAKSEQLAGSGLADVQLQLRPVLWQ
jgi:hypothetical protein